MKEDESKFNWEREARRIVDEKAKPLQSLGLLEEWAIQLSALQRTTSPSVGKAKLIVFAGDHGVVEEKVSAFPQSVTASIFKVFASRSCAGPVLASAIDAGCGLIDTIVVDVGINGQVDNVKGCAVHAKVRLGTRNLAKEPAMNSEECSQAMGVGRQMILEAVQEPGGCDVVCIGELGIGNTTSAAALLSAYTCGSPDQVCGSGSGLTAEGVQHKATVVASALSLHKAVLDDPTRILETFGGLEIAAMVGAILQCHEHGIAVLVDGFIACSAALAACQIVPKARRACFLTHRSAEKGMRHMQEALGGPKPILEMDLRLGEGTGAVLALPILRAAAAMMCRMITLNDALQL